MKSIYTVLSILMTLTAAFLSLAGCDQEASPGWSPLELSIKRIEAGLLPGTLIKGRPVPFMNLEDRMRHYRVPGVSIAVINNGQVEWARGYGRRHARTPTPVTPETLFQAASISKPVSAMAALALVEAGSIELDEDVNRMLSSWKIPGNEFTSEEKVTLRRILSHTAGLTIHGFSGYAQSGPLPTLLEILDGTGAANSEAVRVNMLPGTMFRYSGGGYVVLQLLLEDVTGKSFSDLVSTLVFDKIQMTHSCYQPNLPPDLALMAASAHSEDGSPVSGRWHRYPELAAASLWTTPTDLARFAIEIQNSLAGKANHVLSQEMTKQMLTAQSVIKGDAPYGLGLQLGGAKESAWFSHGGSNLGFECQMVAFNETGQGAVVMTNAANGGWLVREILHGIAYAYGWPAFRPIEKTVMRVDRSVYEEFVGEYVSDAYPDFPLRIRTEAGHPVLTVPAAGIDFRLYPESETRYFTQEIAATISFQRDTTGNVDALKLQWEGVPGIVAKKKMN